MSELPLAAASRRLRRPAGRPRIRPTPPAEPRNPGRSDGLPKTGPPPAPAPGAAIREPCGCRVAAVTTAPRLLGLEDAGHYLGLSAWLVRDLIRAQALRPVEIPLPPDRRGRRALGVVRKVLLDVRDLDALVERAKAGADGGSEARA